MAEPRTIVRFPDLKKFIPVGRTIRDELIAQGLLKVVPLTPKGRAKGVTLELIVRYQREVMGLEPVADNRPHCAHPGERERT